MSQCSDETFIEIFNTEGARGLVDAGYYKSERGVYKRKDKLLAKGYKIHPPSKSPTGDHPERHLLEVKSGTVLIGADGHYWPHYISTAHRGLVSFAERLQPKVIIVNGDMLDGARSGRHPKSYMEESRPTLKDELTTVQQRLDEIRKAAPNARLVWPLGNHDWRFEGYLVNNAPEFEGIPGASLKDHFPEWVACMSCRINEDVVVKHRFKGGVHAAHNNTLWSGMTIVTGHLHAGKITPFADYRGNRWGIDLPTLADPYGPQFMYQEDNPRNHRSGFAVLDFVDGVLLQPHLALVTEEGKIDFCREIYDV